MKILPLRVRLLVPVAAALALSVPRTAAAQPSASDRAAAETLFNQALELLEKNKAADACPKLQESQRLDPGVGTLLYLADCYKQVGKTASAWGTFREAAYAASAAGQKDREELATKEATALEAVLSKLVISVEKPDTPGLKVLRDGQEVGRALWESPVPVDPGKSLVSAEAPGMLAWKEEVFVTAGAGSTTVRVPALQPAPVVATPPPAAAPPAAVPIPAPPPPRESESGGGGVQRGLGWLGVGLGAVGLVGGGVLGIVAKANYESSRDGCRKQDNDSLCNADAIDRGERAQSMATAATVTVGVGGALLVGGIVMIVTAPSSRSGSAPAVGLVARGAPGQGRLSLEGTW
jgi:serine/threonine-protein kinase